MTRFGTRAGLAVAVSIAVLTALHYTTGHEAGDTPHFIYRRLFYLPVLGAAMAFGVRGGLVAAGAVVLAYVPHAFGWWGLHRDPSAVVDKVAEMLLYGVLGALVGGFVDRARAAQRRLEALVEQRDATIGERDAALRERDATIEERDAANRELRAAQSSLAHAENQAALGSLTAGLAHEIRNPLGAIRGAAEIVRDGATGEQRRFGDLLVSETERLDAVLTRFLQFAGQEPREVAPTDLGALAADVVGLVRAEARGRAVQVEHHVEGVVPTVDADAGRLRQLLLNLVVNAMQVQPEGGVVRVATGLIEEPGMATLFVRVDDSGPGVPPSDRAAVFHPYWSTRRGGTGLGLAIAQQVAVEHHGTLSVSDSPLGGARFELRLPGARV